MIDKLYIHQWSCLLQYVMHILDSFERENGRTFEKYQILLTSVFILRKGYSPGEAIKSIPSSNRLKITRCRSPIFQSSSTV